MYTLLIRNSDNFNNGKSHSRIAKLLLTSTGANKERILYLSSSNNDAELCNHIYHSFILTTVRNQIHTCASWMTWRMDEHIWDAWCKRALPMSLINDANCYSSLNDILYNYIYSLDHRTSGIGHRTLTSFWKLKLNPFGRSDFHQKKDKIK